MSCTNRRSYLQQPKSLGTQLPPVPGSPNNFEALTALLTQMKAAIEGKLANPNRPEAVRNFRAEENGVGIRLLWERTQSARFYVLFKGTTSALNQANVIHTAFADSETYEFWDAGGQHNAYTPLYYWIQAYNEVGDSGPVSAPVLVEDPGTAGFHPLNADYVWTK